MIREVDLVSYLPDFMKNYKEPIAVLKAEDPEFYVLWNEVDQIFRNRFISTSNEYGISRYEKILGIYPNEMDSLEDRRSRVQSRWGNSIPYTIRTLVIRLTELLGGDYNYSLCYDFQEKYELELTIYLEDDEIISKEIHHILSMMLPMNCKYSVTYEKGTVGRIYHGAVLCEAEIIEIRQR